MRSTLLLLLLSLFFIPAFAQQGGTEVPPARDMFSKKYEFPDGHFESVIAAAPIHYLDNGNWLPIQTALSSSGTDYNNTTNVIPSHFPAQLSGQFIYMDVNESDRISIEAEKKLVHYTSSSGIQTLNVSTSNANAVVTNNQVTYENVFTNVDDYFEINAGLIKNALIFHQQPASLANLSSGYYGFQQVITLPAGWRITGPAGQQAGWISGELLVKDANNRAQLRLPAPLFFDAQGPADDGRQFTTGGYYLQANNGGYEVTTLAPVSWLNDAARQYSIHIDPTVILSGVDGGWQSPVNVVNNPAFVFVGLCCGNETHRAWLNFNTSSIPSTACINSVELQLNCVAVGGTASETVFVNDITGGPGPYPGVNPAAYQDFGDGNYFDFQATTTGTYGYYSLGATAATDLQNLLPSGYFELGFHLLDEFSTDWKRFDATSSSIRVDHGPAGSCSLLGVEIADFDATCGDNQQQISWTVANETPLNSYEVQQSVDGIQFSSISELAVNPSQNGVYNFDYLDIQNTTNYYRLVLKGHNGQEHYSPTISSECPLNEENISIYPNPVSGQTPLQLDFYRNQSGTLAIHILNTLGQIVYEKQLEVNQGRNQHVVELSKLPPGTYEVILKDTERQYTRKIIKQ